jgi:TonB-dependent starch-binding outer membrane protein SusC
MEFEVLCGIPPDATSKRKTSLRKTLLLMKLVLLFITIASLQAWSKAQSQPINLSVKQATLEKVFKEIRRQTTYRFIYTKEELAMAHVVSIEVKDVGIEEVMNLCFRDQPLTFSIAENHVIIRKKKEQATTSPLKPDVVRLLDVRGRVVNDKGDPVEGVSVSVKGTNNITATNLNGEFYLTGVAENAVFLFTAINIEPYERRLSGENYLSVMVQTKISKLDEVQVIGYGINTQRYNTGSVTKVTAEEISKQPVSNPLAALQGRVPGLTVSSTSGLPGASFKIQVRGQNSVNPDPAAISLNPKFDNPLFIVDGVPFGPQNINVNQFHSVAAPNNPMDPSVNNPFGGISPFDNINPDDIESIEVLRDADATAIYGSRGGNGVILITTKKGKAGKTKFNFKMYSGISKVPEAITMMNTQQYLQMRDEAFKNDGIVPSPAPGSSGYAPDLMVFDSTKYTDWRDYFLENTANTTGIYGSITGGTANTQFLIGSGFRRETYIFPGDFHYNGYSFNSNISHQSTNKKLSLLFSSGYSFNKNNSPGGPGISSVFKLEPNYPDLLDNSGNLVWEYKGISLNDGVSAPNPLSYLRKKYNIKKYNLISNFQISYQILKNLTLRTSLGYNNFDNKEYQGNPKSSFDPSRNAESSAQFGNLSINSWIIEPQLEYNKALKIGKLNFLLGTTFQQNQTSSTNISASGYQSDALMESVSAASSRTASDANSQYKYDAVFGRINFIAAKKYVVNLSGRRDGSSRFGPKKQYGNFGAVGTGWIISEEKFIKKALGFISYAKLHLSYGSTGSDAIGDYQYISRWRPTDYASQGSVGYLPQNLFNPQFSWAVTRKFEAGIEIGLIHDKILTNVTWYQNRSGNQLVSYPLPTQSGFSSVIENSAALVQNSGWELQVTSNNIKTRKFSWTTTANLTVPRNKLVAFPGIENSSYKNQYIVGQSLSVLYKYKYLGVNDTAGIFQFESSKKQATYTPIIYDDYQVIGDLDPKFYGSLGNYFSFGGVEMGLFLEFKKQLGVNYLGAIYSASPPGTQFNQPQFVLNHWQKPGDRFELQKLTTQTFSLAGQARSYFLTSSGIYSDASYIRFKTVSVSYSLSSKYLSKIKMESCKIYLNAQNLFTITNYKGIDPETQSFYGVPVMRTIVAGIQFTL